MDPLLNNNSLNVIEFFFIACLVTLVITGLGADFTRLESFGKVDAFAETLVGFKISHLDSTKKQLGRRNHVLGSRTFFNSA